MSSSRVPLLCAFGVGCLSTAVLFGFWQADKRADASSATKARVHNAELVTASLVAPTSDRQREVSADSARTAEPAPVELAERGDALKDDAPAVAKESQDGSSAAPSPGGSAVSDVLMDLEAAYRQRLIAAARAEAEAARSTPELPTTPPPSAAPAEPAREVAAPATVPVAAVAPAAVAVATPPAEPPPVVPPAPPAPVMVAQNDARPPEVHIGDVNQNTYITNVRQGDVYVIQQQLAMLNYMQMLGNSAYPPPAYAAQPVHPLRGSAQRPPQSVQFKSTLTNLDNP